MSTGVSVGVTPMTGTIAWGMPSSEKLVSGFEVSSLTIAIEGVVLKTVIANSTTAKRRLTMFFTNELAFFILSSPIIAGLVHFLVDSQKWSGSPSFFHSRVLLDFLPI